MAVIGPESLSVGVISPDGQFVALDEGETTRVQTVAPGSEIARLEVPAALDWNAISEREIRRGSYREVTAENQRCEIGQHPDRWIQFAGALYRHGAGR